MLVPFPRLNDAGNSTRAYFKAAAVVLVDADAAHSVPHSRQKLQLDCASQRRSNTAQNIAWRGDAASSFK